MATRREYQLAVTNAGINVRGKTQTLNEAQLSLAQSQAVLADLQSRPVADARAILNAQAAIQREQNAVRAAGIELNQAKTALTSAQLELNNPDQVFDPEPVRASDAVTLTQEQRNRLDQINEDRINKDLEPLVPSDPAALSAVNASFSAEQAAQNTATVQSASANTAGDSVANTQGSVVPAETPKEQGLRNWNELLAERGAAPVGIDDPDFNASYARIIAANPSLGETTPSVEPGRNTGTSTGDFIEADALSSAEANRVTRDADPADDRTGTVLESDNPPKLKEGWSNDGTSYAVNMSGTRDPGTVTKPSAAINIGNKTNVVNYKPVDNPLHAYPSYTYNLSLHVLSNAEYKSLMESPGSRFSPKTTLIGGANRYGQVQPKGPRDPAFTDDFYFDEFKMMSIIGLNHDTRGGNTVDLSFKLIEPYGMTFLNRLLDLSVRLKKRNYLDIPYLLEISFFGADDKGMYAKLDQHTKLIPIRLIKAKIRAGTKGSEYDISAIPYGQVGKLESIQATKANFEISGRTVRDYFSSKGSGYAATQQQVQDKAREQQQKKDNIARVNETAKNSNVAIGTVNGPTAATISSSSFADAYNLWQTTEVEHGYLKVADEVVFDIDPAIADTKIIEPITANPAKSSMSADQLPGAFGEPPKNATSKQDLKPGSPKPAGADFTKSFFNIPAGTAITTVLNNMIVNSEFITKQVTEVNKAMASAPAAGATNTKPAKPLTAGSVSANSLSAAAGRDVQWYKITTKVELKEFDDKRNFHGKKITFFVRPYTHYNASHPYAAQSQPKGAVKEYNYLYTGKNKDIIDFSLDFDTLFHTLVTVDPAKRAALVTNPNAETAGGGTGVGQTLPGYQVTINQVVHNSGTMSSQTTVDEASVKIKAANLADNIYMGSAGDMLKLNLKIIGDPHFIKQDEILFSADKIPNKGSQFVDKEGGSLATDNGEIFCKVIFKTPVDIDEITGLVRKNSAWKDVYFGGMFKIQKVTSEFRQGKFIQELFMIRQRNQEGDSKGSGTDANSAAQRSDPKAGAKDPALTKGTIKISDDGSKLIEWGNGEYAAIDNENNLGEIRQSNASGNVAADRPGTDPVLQAVRDNAATTDDYENAGMSSGPDFPLPDEASADPNQALLRDVAQNGPTAAIEENSDESGETIVGAPSATTQAAAPPQPAPVVNEPVPDPAATTQQPTPATQTPPVQTAPQSAPATAVQRQSTASTAQLDALVAQSGDLVKQYAALQAGYQPQLAKLQALAAEYDKILKLKSQAENNPDQLEQLEVERTRLFAARMELTATMTSTRNELVRVSRANDDIGKQIAAIKANTTNEDAELNTALDAVDARQRSTARF
jgi:hypothetical protein